MIDSDIISKLDAYCRENGITPPPNWTITNDKKIVRYKTEGSSNSGSYLLFDNKNNFHLLIMDWAKGETNFRAAAFRKSGSGDYCIEPMAIDDCYKEKFRLEREKVYAETAARCKEKYASLRDATPENPYCRTKKILPAAGWKEDDRGTLYIPFIAGGGSLEFDPERITTLERIWIDEAGKAQKRWEKGGRKKGSYFPIKGDVTGHVFLAEGSATAKSIVEATRCSCIMAGDCGNLEHIAKMFPKAIVIADNDSDKSNAGEEAAKKTGLEYKLIPDIGMDANDYAASYGASKLKSIILPYPPGCKPFSPWLSEKRPRSWILEGIFAEGPGVYMEHGPSQGGKTHLKISQQIALATGTEWMGRRTKQCKVLSLIGESEASEQERFIANMIARPEISKDELEEHFFTCTDTFPINEEFGRKKLCRILDFFESYGMKIDIMFIDSLRIYYSGKEVDNDETSMFMNTLKEIATKYNICIVFYCHAKKADKNGNISDQARGGQSLFDLSEAVHRIHNEDGVIHYENQKKKIDELDTTFYLDIVSCELEGETDNFGNAIKSAYLRVHPGSIPEKVPIEKENPGNAAEKSIKEFMDKYKSTSVDINTLLNLYEEEYKKKYPIGKALRGNIPGESFTHYESRVKDAVKSRKRALIKAASETGGKYELKDGVIAIKGMHPIQEFTYAPDEDQMICGGEEDEDDVGRICAENSGEYGDGQYIRNGIAEVFSDEEDDEDDEPDVPFPI